MGAWWTCLALRDVRRQPKSSGIGKHNSVAGYERKNPIAMPRDYAVALLFVIAALV